MPIFFPQRARHKTIHPAMHTARRACAAGLPVAAWLLAVILGSGIDPALAQTLARPGLVGNGLSTDAWWQHAIFYQVEQKPGDASPDFRSITATLDALRLLGVDALLVPAPRPPAHSVTGSLAAITPNAGPDATMEDFDDLIHQASRRGMRVLLNLPVPGDGSDVSGIARFWLSRGVAGFHAVMASGTAPQTAQTMVQALRKVTAGVVGQRIVISDFDPALAAAVGSASRGVQAKRTDRLPDPVAGQLQIDARIGKVATMDAAGLRPLLAQTVGQANLMVEFRSPTAQGSLGDSAGGIASSMAAVALTIHAAALIDSSAGLVLEKSVDGAAGDAVAPVAASAPPSQPAPPPPGTYVPYVPAAPAPAVAAAPKAAAPASARSSPDALTAWYQELAAMHHANATLRMGTATLLDFDGQDALVWVVRPATSSALTPPVVVACNLSGSPVTLGVGAAIQGLNLRGTYLRTLLRSDKGMGPQDIDGVVLPAYGVYVGELRR